MSTQHTPELFAQAAAFYEQQPTGQYDNEAAHALRCHHELLEALQTMPHPEYRTGITNLTDEWCEWDAKRRAAIAKATGATA